MIGSETTSVKIGHALQARSEMKMIADEFRVLASATLVATRAMDTLYHFIDRSAVSCSGAMTLSHHAGSS